MVGRISVKVENMDRVLERFGNQLAAVGEGKARIAMARALNRAGTTVRTKVVRSIVSQTSIPRQVVNREIKSTRAAQKGAGALQFTIWARGSEIPLKEFNAKQFAFGVRAKVWGKMQRFPGAFMGPSPGRIAPGLKGHVWTRAGADRLPIEISYGPSIPKEMVLSPTREEFQETARIETEKRLRHELSRLLT